MRDENEAAKNVYVEITKYLFALGMSKQTRREILNDIEDLLDKRNFSRIEITKVVTERAEEQVSSIENVNELTHTEDRELFSELISLPFVNRAALILHHFYDFSNTNEILPLNEDETNLLEVSEKMLANRLKEQLGFLMGSAELQRLLQFVKQDIDNLEWGEEEHPVQVKSSTTSSFPLEIPKRSYKRPLFYTSGVFIFLAGLMILLTIGGESVSDSIKTGEDSSLESELEKLDKRIEEEIERVSEVTSLSPAEMDLVYFTNQTLTAQASLHERAASAETEGEIDELRTEVGQLMAEVSYYFETPMERLISNGSSIEIKYESETPVVSDGLLNEFLIRSEGIEEVYEEKLQEIEPGLASLQIDAIEDFAFSSEAKSLIETIEKNGFQVLVNAPEQTFQVTPGGSGFESQTAEILSESYLLLLNEMQHFPYVYAGKTNLTFEQISNKLLETEEILKNLAYGTSLSNPLLREHSRLLSYFIRGGGEKGESIYENGRLRDEVITAWESISTDQVNLVHSSTSRYIKMLYDTYKKTDFQPSETSEEILERQKGIPVETGMRTEVLVYPLRNALYGKYNMYNVYEDDQDIQMLNTVEIATLYINALMMKDHEMAYKFMAKTEPHPQLEEWMKEDLSIVNELKFDEIVEIKNMSYAGVDEDINLAIVTINYMTSSPKDLEMIKEEGIWKVKYMKNHLTKPWEY